MGVVTAIKESLRAVLTGESFVTGVLNTVQKYFPPDISPEKKADLQLELQRLAAQQQTEARVALQEAERLLNERVAMFEGTATDLRAIPFLGPLTLFLRGLQRLVWGYGVLYLDFMWFSGRLPTLTNQQESALWIINLLVLGFLFGEKAVQNLAPLVSEVMQKSKLK